VRGTSARRWESRRDALDIWKVVEIDLLEFEARSPWPRSDIDDRKLVRDIVTILEPGVQYPVQSERLLVVAMLRVFRLARVELEEMVHLPQHRPEVGHLPHEPLHHPEIFGAALGRRELAGLMGEVKKDGPRFEQ
jgi:hypothetical protein